MSMRWETATEIRDNAKDVSTTRLDGTVRNVKTGSTETLWPFTDQEKKTNASRVTAIHTERM